MAAGSADMRLDRDDSHVGVVSRKSFEVGGIMGYDEPPWADGGSYDEGVDCHFAARVYGRQQEVPGKASDASSRSDHPGVAPAEFEVDGLVVPFPR